MCILILNKKGYRLPKKEILKTCYKNNDDGCGYAFSTGKEIIIKKGFFSFDTFYQSLKEDNKKYNLFNKNVLLHFRIATSGGIQENKTHPFILTNKSKVINRYKKEIKTTDPVIGHNGIFSDYVFKNNLSDTQNFILNFLYPIYKSNLKDNIKNHLIKQEIDTSKLIILEKDGSVKTYGDFILSDGTLYSNSSYKEKYYYTSYNYNYYDYDFKQYDILEEEKKETKEKQIQLEMDMYDYIKNNLKEITSNSIYCDGYFFDRYDGFKYYLDETTGEIWELNDYYKTTSYIGNNYY